MPRVAARPPQLQGTVFRSEDVVAAGLLTRRQLDGPAWRRVLPGVYADARTHLTHGVLVSAARLLLPPTAAIAGRSAGWLYGAHDLVDENDPVEVLVPTTDRFGPVGGLVVHCAAVVPPEALTPAGVATRARAAADVARWAPSLTEAVVRLDQLLAAGALTAKELPDVLHWLCRGRGTARARRACELADGRAQSPPESRVRVSLTLAGLPPVPQYEIFHEGRLAGRVDLAYPRAKLAIEYDGGWHAEAGQFARDRARLNRLTAAGWRVLHLTAADLRDLDRVVATVAAALAA